MTQRGRGRPPKISEVLIGKIVQAVRAGSYLETAAAAAGISRETLRKWMRRGERELQRTDGHNMRSTRKSEQLYVDLVVGLTRAQAEAETYAAAVLMQAARGQEVTKERRLTKYGPARADGTRPIVSEEVVLETRLVKDWRAALEWLKLRHSDRWAPVDRTAALATTDATDLIEVRFLDHTDTPLTEHDPDSIH